MSELSQALGNAGAKHRLDNRGKVYEFSLVTQKLKDAFQKRYFEHEKRALAEMRDLYPAPDYLAEVKGLHDRYKRGELNLLSRDGMAWVQTEAGAMTLVSLLAGCDENEALGLVADRGEEVQSLIRLIFFESFPGLEERIAEAEKEAQAAGEPVPN